MPRTADLGCVEAPLLLEGLLVVAHAEHRHLGDNNKEIKI